MKSEIYKRGAMVFKEEDTFGVLELKFKYLDESDSFYPESIIAVRSYLDNEMMRSDYKEYFTEEDYKNAVTLTELVTSLGWTK